MKGKKLLLSLAAFGLLAGLVGCNNGAKSEESKKSESSQQPASSVEPASSSEEPVSSVESASSSVEPESSQTPATQQQIKVVGAGGVKKITGIGKTLQLTANVGDEALTGVTWASKNTAVATVDQNGVVTSVSKGSAQITANKEGYKEGVLAISVDLEKIEISSEGDAKKITGLNQTLQLSAKLNGEPLTGVTWASKNADIASVSNTGLVTSVGKGSTSITASLEPYAEATFSISVELEKINVAAADNKVQLLAGETVQLSADRDGVEWKTSNAELATVSNAGLVTANSNMKYGTVTISAEKAGFDAGSIEISVVRPAPTAVLHMEDAEHYAADGEWSSSNDPTESPVYNKSNASDGTTCAHFGGGDIETIRFSSSKAVQAEIVLMVGYYYAVENFTSVYEVKLNNTPITIPDGQSYTPEDTTNYTYQGVSFGLLNLIADTNVLEIKMKEDASRIPYMDDLNIYAAEAATIVLVPAPQKDPVTVNQESLTVAEGASVQITSAMTGLSYKSASTAIATVDENGLVSGVKVGETTIAVSKDGYKTIRVPVTVTEAAGVIAVSINAGTSEGDVVTFRTSRNLEEPYNYIVDAFPANAVLTFTVNATTAGAYNMYMRCRASGGYNSSTTDDLATCMEVKVNDVAVAAAGTVSGSSFNDYLLGEVNLVAGDNTITIKCLTAVPTANLLRFIPKA